MLNSKEPCHDIVGGQHALGGKRQKGLALFMPYARQSRINQGLNVRLVFHEKISTISVQTCDVEASLCAQGKHDMLFPHSLPVQLFNVPIPFMGLACKPVLEITWLGHTLPPPSGHSTCSHSQVVCSLPVTQVVAAGMALSREIGNLVVLKTPCFEHLVSLQEHLRKGVFLRKKQLSLLNTPFEPCPFFYCEAIGRDMVR